MIEKDSDPIAKAIQADTDRERALQEMINNNLVIIAEYWNYGDGEGGALIFKIVDALRSAGYPAASRQYDEFHEIASGTRTALKAHIPADLRTLVMERDLHRCVVCGTHRDLTIDHIYPESKGGSLDPGNLQTMCRSCNSKKGARHQGDST